MAEIPIYGTLENRTGEPIARADQIIDPGSGKMVSDLLHGSGTVLEYMTDQDADAMIAELFPVIAGNTE